MSECLLICKQAAHDESSQGHIDDAIIYSANIRHKLDTTACWTITTYHMNPLPAQEIIPFLLVKLLGLLQLLFGSPKILLERHPVNRTLTTCVG